MSDGVDQSPYEATVWSYRRAGWSGVLPLPANAKGPVPRGFTGWAGSDPSGPDIQAWIDGGVRLGRASYAVGNIGLRLPRGAYGLDVDDYGSKTGGLALGKLVQVCGPLPATWIVSSREDSTSGIRLFRADHGEGRVWRNEPGGHGAGIESIHFGHRYAVVWPSMHPDTGRKYRFRRPDGVEVDGEVPRLDELPVLPPRWVFELSETGAIRAGDMAGHAETVATVNGWQLGEPCRRTVEAHARGLERIARAINGDALHPSALESLHELTNLGNEGHRGVKRALGEHHDVFIEARRARAATAGGEDSAGAEWWRMVRGAVGKLLPDQYRAECDCDLWAGVGLDLDWPGGATSNLAGIGNNLGDPAPIAAAVVDPFGDPAPLDVVDLIPHQPAAVEREHLDDGSPLAILRREFVTARQMGSRPAPVPIVSGLLYRDTLSWMIGKSGSFKSFVALDLAAHVAAGREWAGRRVWGGPVVYLVAEGVGGMPLRVRAWESANGEISENLIMLPRAVQVTGAGWPVFIEAACAYQPVMIIVDTQARVTVGVQENDNADMGQMIERLALLQRHSRSCVLIVHHIGRQGDDARGASAIDGAQDTELKVARKGRPDELRAVLSTDKQKEGPDNIEIELRARVVALGADPLTGEPLNSLVITPDMFADPFPPAPWREDLVANQVAILNILREMYSELGGTTADVRSIMRERGGYSPKWLKSGFAYAWDALLKKDCLARVGTSQRFVVINENATQAIDTSKISKVQMSETSPEPLASALTEPLNLS